MASKTRADPTGQRTNRAKTYRALDTRLTSAEVEIKRVFNFISKETRTVKAVINQDKVVYDYDLSDTEQQALNKEIQAILDEELETEPDTNPPRWWYEPHIELPYRQGTLEQIVEFNRLIEAAAVTGILVDGAEPKPIPTESILQNRKYRSSLDKTISTSYQDVKGLSTKTASQVIRAISKGIASFLSPKKIIQAITERFEVARSDSKRIATTQVNAAYNSARLNSVKIASDQSGLTAGVIHISALLPTTRDHHAARHGNAYTVEAQTAWWNEDANLINCFVSETEVKGRFIAGLKSVYTGKVIKLMTRNGRSLTVTANHEILTDRGLMAAAKLKKGDNLIAYVDQIKDTIRIANLNDHYAYTTIEQVFAALSERSKSEAIGISRVDFNGDERFIDENINRIFADRVLVQGGNSSDFQFLDDLKFIHASSTNIRNSAFYERFDSVFTTTSGILSSLAIILSRFTRFIFGSIELRFRETSPSETNLAQSSIDSRSRQTNVGRYGINRLPIQVTLDDIVDINILDFSGHVYDLQELSGLMIANGIITSNCHCTTRSVLIDSKGRVVQKEEQEAIKSEKKDFQDQ